MRVLYSNRLSSSCHSEPSRRWTKNKKKKRKGWHWFSFESRKGREENNNLGMFNSHPMIGTKIKFFNHFFICINYQTIGSIPNSMGIDLKPCSSPINCSWNKLLFGNSKNTTRSWKVWVFFFCFFFFLYLFSQYFFYISIQLRQGCGSMHPDQLILIFFLKEFKAQANLFQSLS